MNVYLRSGLAISTARERNLADAPGGGVVRRRTVRVRKANGTVSEAFDIRQLIGIDVVFDVLEGGSDLTPNLHVFDQQGVNVFITHDVDPSGRR